MADSIATELVSALRDEKPVVLFLGQDYASFGGRFDPVLEALLNRIGKGEQLSSGWSGVLGSNPLSDEDFQWLSERFQRNVQPQALDDVLDIGWSAVFTTSIDPKLLTRLESRGRMPEAVLAKDHFSRVPRSRSRPAIHYLLGRSDEHDLAYRAPRSRMELRQRIAVHTNQLLNRIAETVTPLGLLVVDGYTANQDWLPIDDLLAPLSQSLGLRILWFGVDAIPESDFFHELVRRGNLLHDPRRLAEVVAEIYATEPDQVLGITYQGEAGTISLSDNNFLQISPSLRLRVEASAAVVDDTWTDTPPLLFGADEIEAFRRFHGDFGGARSLLEGIGKGYAIKREFEKRLLSTVESTLRNPGSADSFIVVHGQSGVGKSIALARLARNLREEHKLPLLFAWGRVPAASDLDDFCAECERAGALATVIICDANQWFERYRELTNGLKSRGRRIVVVGSSYKVEDSRLAEDIRFVEASSEIASTELIELRKLLHRFGGQDANSINSALVGDHVLALLYRHLSVSRAKIIGGIAGEARSAETTIRIRARNLPQSKKSGGILAEKLIEAGLRDGQTAVFEDDEPGAATGSDTAGRLIDYIMVAGRLDCAVPVNLVIRALRALQDDFDLIQIAYLFGDLDLFRWHMANAEGNDLLVQPRLQLEAELICRRRLSDQNREIECLIELIEAIRVTGVDRKSELVFLLDLLHKLHRDGPRRQAYSPGYLKIARALTKLRVRHQVIDASVMLQESAFRRAALFASDRPDATLGTEISDAKRDEILNEAREVVELALQQIEEGKLRAGRKTRHNFLVERASIYGFLAVGLARREVREEEVWSNYLAARTAIYKAMSVGGNYFSQDVGIWTPADILKTSNLSPVHRAELQADIFSVIDHVNTDLLPTLAEERFQIRRMKVGDILKNSELEEDAFLTLEQSNPAVAYYLKARSMCPDNYSDNDEPVTSDVRDKAAIAANFLFERFDKITADVRALQLLLQLHWIARTGRRLLRKERCVLPSDRNFQAEILEIVSLLNRAAGEGGRNVFRFLEAALEWLRGDPVKSRHLFKGLADDTEFEDPSRVIRRLVLDGSAGDWMGFRGRVEKLRSEGHWSISVEGFQGTVDLLARDFSSEDLRPGREIRRFTIAFNYLGPIADPLTKHGGRP